MLKALGFSRHTQLFTLQDVNWWTGILSTVDYCDVFISCLDSHSDGTHSLQRIHWCSNEETNSSTSRISWRLINFQQFFFYYGWTIPLLQSVTKRNKKKLHHKCMSCTAQHNGWVVYLRDNLLVQWVVRISSLTIQPQCLASKQLITK